ncbi:hypothetical protein R6Q59_031143 [Mikania micrantha]
MNTPTQPMTQRRPMLDLMRYQLQNVSGDGNCRYRALAVCLGIDEHKYYEYIRQQKKRRFTQHIDIYKQYLSVIDILVSIFMFLWVALSNTTLDENARGRCSNC